MLVRVLVAFLAAAAAILLRLAIDPLVGAGNVPYITLLVTLVFLGWYTGIWPALAALVASGIAVQIVILEPAAIVTIRPLQQEAGLAVYCIAGTLCVLLGRTLGHLRETAEHHLRQARALQAQLAEKAGELEQADRRKDEFLATLAHELRNPLSVLRNGLALLAQLPPGAPEFADVRSRMERQLAHVVRLIDDLLDLSRISQGTIVLRKEDVLIADILRDAVEACRPSIEAKRHHLRVQLIETPVVVVADPTRLTQVITNLLSNACKFTPDEGNISVIERFERGEVIIAVHDDGPGIPAEIQSHIFELFVQGHEGKGTAQGGLGVGLHLAKRLVTLHGGTLTVSSGGENSGSTFTVRLPAKVQSAGWNA